ATTAIDTKGVYKADFGMRHVSPKILRHCARGLEPVLAGELRAAESNRDAAVWRLPATRRCSTGPTFGSERRFACWRRFWKRSMIEWQAMGTIQRAAVT